MRKALTALAAAAMTLGVLAFPAGPASAAGSPELVCNIQPSEYTDYSSICDSDIPASSYGIVFEVQGGSGTYSYSWSVPAAYHIVSGCTSTSSSCGLTVRSNSEHDLFMSVVLTQGGTQTTLTAEAYTPAVCGRQLC